MTTPLDILRLSLAGAMAAALAGVSLAATPSALDKPAGSTVAPAIEILRPDKPLAAPVAPTGNPLWAIPLSMLPATRERPIFLPSRRPPAPVIAAPRVGPASARAATPQPPAEPTRPALALVGAVVGETEAIAIFVDQTTKNVLRLKTGQGHGGWVLSSVKGREATFQKDQLTAVFVLPAPGEAAPAGAPMNPSTAVVVPSGGEAPFVPRSTPKNGESDGL